MNTKEKELYHLIDNKLLNNNNIKEWLYFLIESEIDLLSYCAYHNHHEIVSLILQYNVDYNKISILYNPLGWSVVNASYESFLLLLNKTDHNITFGEYQRSLIQCAIMKGSNYQHNRTISDYIKIVEHLLPISDINYQDINGYSALHYACYYNNLDFIKLLIKYNADLYLINKDGNKAISYIKDKNLKKQVKKIIKKLL